MNKKVPIKRKIILFFDRLIQQRPYESLVTQGFQTKLCFNFYSNIYQRWKFDFLEKFSGGLQPNSGILDLGCGEGTLLLDVVRKHDGFYGIGVDISRESLKKAVKRAKRLKINHLMEFLQCDVQFLPFKENAFEGVFVNDLLHHLLDLSVIRSLRRAIKNRGKLLLMDLPMNNPLTFLGRKIACCINSERYGYIFLDFTSGMLKHTLQKSGFKILEEERKEYFLGFLWIFVKYLPLLRVLLTNRLLMVLYHIEEWLKKIPLINRLNACIIFLCYNLK